MSQLLVVFGATGNQGGSVARYVVKDPGLSKKYKVRGITRDTTKPAAQELKKLGIEIVAGDQERPETLEQALQGAHTVFGVTATVYDEHLKQRELDQGKAMVDAAVAAGAKYFIFSTLTSPEKVTGGKMNSVGHFDVKYEIEQYIRKQPIASAFFAPGSFMQNFSHMMTPRPAGDGTHAIFNFVTPSTKLPLIDINETGKYVGAILADPEKHKGQILFAATNLVPYSEIVDIMSKATGKTVTYKQIPKEAYAGFLPVAVKDYLVGMFEWIQDYGYYGPGTEEKVRETADLARGKLTTLEEWLEKNPLHLV